MNGERVLAFIVGGVFAIAVALGLFALVLLAWAAWRQPLVLVGIVAVGITFVIGGAVGLRVVRD